MAAAMAPATSLRFTPYSTLRFLSSYSVKNTKILPVISLISSPVNQLSLTFSGSRRCFCTIIAGAIHSDQTNERTKQEFIEKWKGESGKCVGEFRKKLRIADIKGGNNEGLNRLGRALVVEGWVRTVRVQSSVTFLEVHRPVNLFFSLSLSL